MLAMPSILMPGNVRYRLSDVVAFEEESLRKSTSEPYRPAIAVADTKNPSVASRVLSGSRGHLGVDSGYC